MRGAPDIGDYVFTWVLHQKDLVPARIVQIYSANAYKVRFFDNQTLVVGPTRLLYHPQAEGAFRMKAAQHVKDLANQEIRG